MMDTAGASSSAAGSNSRLALDCFNPAEQEAAIAWARLLVQGLPQPEQPYLVCDSDGPSACLLQGGPSPLPSPCVSAAQQQSQPQVGAAPQQNTAHQQPPSNTITAGRATPAHEGLPALAPVVAVEAAEGPEKQAAEVGARRHSCQPAVAPWGLALSTAPSNGPGSQDAQVLTRLPSAAVRAAAAPPSAAAMQRQPSAWGAGSEGAGSRAHGSSLHGQGAMGPPLLLARALDTSSTSDAMGVHRESSAAGLSTGGVPSRQCSSSDGAAGAVAAGGAGAPVADAGGGMERDDGAWDGCEGQRVAATGAHAAGSCHPEITPASPHGKYHQGTPSPPKPSANTTRSGSAEEPPVSLLQLPSGVLECIARASGPSGMRQLRLTCSALRGCVDGGVKSVVVDSPHVDPARFPHVEHLVVGAVMMEPGLL